MSKFPVLISIPHGGTRMPEEIADRVCISPKDQFDDGDAFTREIYGIKDDVIHLVDTDIARVFVDLNRETTDLPPKNPDGVVKSQTCHGKPIYFPGKELDPDSIETLLQKYYVPYHQKIRDILRKTNTVQLILDCHTMEPVGPEISPDPGKKRPKICLGSRRGESCPMNTVQLLASSFQKTFQLKDSEITIDQPFSGGFITKTYGNKPISCIQIEMNRILYLSDPWFDRAQLAVDPARLAELREKFKKTLNQFFLTQP